jgi:hypothetical protein
VNAAEGARRLVEDVQRLGLSSASAVVDRYAVAVEEALGIGPSVGSTAAPDPGTLVEVTARMAQAYLGLLDGLAGLADAPRVRAEAGVETVRLPATPRGTSSRASLWVHNGTAEPVATAVRLGPLVSADGVTLRVGTATLESPTVEVPAGGRAEVLVRVDVPADQPPGTYFGLALAPGAGPLALRLDVQDGAAP